jgi:hypothetical protein
LKTFSLLLSTGYLKLKCRGISSFGASIPFPGLLSIDFLVSFLLNNLVLWKAK